MFPFNALKYICFEKYKDPTYPEYPLDIDFLNFSLNYYLQISSFWMLVS